MKKQEFLCDYCGNECVIELFSVIDEAEYCPICGKQGADYMDEYEDDEWED